jgi:hypothetical protein
MDRLKQLEIKKLIKELDYIESDFEYKSEIISENDGKFMSNVNIFLGKNPELKEIFDKKVNKKIEDIINKQSENTEILKADEEDIEEDIKIEDFVVDGNPIALEDRKEEIDTTSAKIKKLYRDIVKITHPDKTKSKKLNDTYIKATILYQKNDLSGIYSICNDLKIDYDLSEEDATNITSKIKTLKDRIVFVESTFTWKWHYSQSDQERDQIIFTYIRMQLQ